MEKAAAFALFDMDKTIKEVREELSIGQNKAAAYRKEWAEKKKGQQ